LSVAVPGKALSPKVRALPLREIPPVGIGALWRGRTTPLLGAFLEEARARARELGEGRSVFETVRTKAA